jgi:hypothetical protein
MDHEITVRFDDQYSAGRAIAHPDEWCSGCQEMIRNGLSLNSRLRSDLGTNFPIKGEAPITKVLTELPAAENQRVVRGKTYQTQWAAQFFAAAEMTRRGYLVTFTLGNARGTDLLVKSPQSIQFSVEVKGLSLRTFWPIQRHEADPNRYYVLVYIERNLASPPRYFILTNDECQLFREEYRSSTIARGAKYDDTFGGFPWSVPMPFENRWSTLPD